MKEQKTLADAVMQKIDQEHIAPTPRWRFLLSNGLLWSVGIFFLLVGAVTVSVIIFAIVNGGWALHQLTRGSILEHVFVILPITWIVLLMVFLFIADYNVRHTKRGYRYGFGMVISASIILSIVLGAGLYTVGFGHLVDTRVGEHLPQYRSIEGRFAALLEKHKDHLLLGRIVEDDDKDGFELVDQSREEWLIVDRGLQPHDWRLVREGARVVVVGKKLDDETFAACAVRPLPLKGARANLHKKRDGRPGRPGSFGKERRKERREELRERFKQERLQNVRGCEHLSDQQPTTDN